MKKFREMDSEEKKNAWAELFNDNHIKGWFEIKNDRLIYYKDWDHFFSVRLLTPEESSFEMFSKTDEEFLVFTLNHCYHFDSSFKEIEYPNQAAPIGKKNTYHYLQEFFKYSWDTKLPGTRQKKMNRHLRYMKEKEPVPLSWVLESWLSANWNKSFFDHEIEAFNLQKYGSKKPSWHQRQEQMTID